MGLHSSHPASKSTSGLQTHLEPHIPSREVRGASRSFAGSCQSSRKFAESPVKLRGSSRDFRGELRGISRIFAQLPHFAAFSLI